MGASSSSFVKRLFKQNDKVRVLMLGLDAAGKTTILYTLRLGEIVTTIPTIGFNVEQIDTKDISFTVWDVGGRQKIRPLWRHYMQNVSGIIWVMDANDRDRIEDAREELHERVLTLLPENEPAVVLLLANKRDLPGAVPAAELVERMELRKLPARFTWQAFETCATTGEGLEPALKWFSSAVGQQISMPGFAEIPPLIRRAEASAAVDVAALARDAGAGALARALAGPLAGAALSDDEFLAAFAPDADGASAAFTAAGTLAHTAQLRLMWLLLRRATDRSRGRQPAVNAILGALERFYSSRGQIFHLTQAYFWLQLVDISLHAPRPEPPAEQQPPPPPPPPLALPEEAHPDARAFMAFLRENPFLLREKLLTEYYSGDLIFHSAESARQFVLPDRKPLPSILSFSRRQM